MLQPTKKELTERVEKLENILDQLYRDFFGLTEAELTEDKRNLLQSFAAWEAVQSYNAIRKVKL